MSQRELDQRELDVLKILVENNELRFHEVLSKIKEECDWGLYADSLRVTLVNVLNRLVGQRLVSRKDLGHKNVRYSLKDPKARKRVELMVKTMSGEWQRIINIIIPRIKRTEKTDSTMDAIGVLLTVFPIIFLFGHLQLICDAGAKGNRDDLEFYGEQYRKMTMFFWDAIMSQLKEVSASEFHQFLISIAHKLGGELTEFASIVSDWSAFLDFLEKKFKTGSIEEVIE